MDENSIYFDLTKPIHRKTYIWKKEEGCAIVISPNGKRMILNLRVTAIWEQIDDSKNAKEIMKSANSESNINFSESQIIEILTNLLKLDLISKDNYLWKEESL